MRFAAVKDILWGALMLIGLASATFATVNELSAACVAAVSAPRCPGDAM